MTLRQLCTASVLCSTLVLPLVATAAPPTPRATAARVGAKAPPTAKTPPAAPRTAKPALPAMRATKPARTPRTQVVEVTIEDGPVGAAPSRHLYVIPVQSSSPAFLRTQDERGELELKVHARDDAGPLEFELSRAERATGAPTRTMQVRTAVRLGRGGQATLARFRNPSGTLTRVSVRAR